MKVWRGTDKYYQYLSVVCYTKNMLSGQSVIGLDIGHASVRVVGLIGSKKPVFRGCKEVAVDQKFLKKDGFENHQAIAQAIRQAMSSCEPKRVSARDVYVTISESAIFRKVIELPKEKNNDNIDEAIIKEAGQYLPDNPDNLEIDYQILGETAQGGVQQVMLVSLSKKYSADILKVLELAKLNPCAFEPKPESVGRVLVPYSTKKAILIVDMGQSTCTVSAYDQGQVKVTSTLNSGTISVFDPSSGETVDSDVVKDRMPKLIGQIADEIDHVSKYYTNRTVHTAEIEQINISGAGSILQGSGEMLAKAVDLPIQEVKPVIIVPEYCDRRFYGALGAALYRWREV